MNLADNFDIHLVKGEYFNEIQQLKQLYRLEFALFTPLFLVDDVFVKLRVVDLAQFVEGLHDEWRRVNELLEEQEQLGFLLGFAEELLVESVDPLAAEDSA